MTEISIDRVNMERRLNEVIDRVDTADAAIGRLPDAPDGGIASTFIAFITSAGVEAAGLTADTARALSVIAIDVIDDMDNTDVEIADELRDLEAELTD
ncbi:hypothetical protein [Leucobacter musarum]|uniref:hypothetical protein n=1 Tax=Leucobacter musarum TaxID=1930747 RepID=UPI0006A7CB22|nr:hypothetical protein [Leucobacter musarum]